MTRQGRKGDAVRSGRLSERTASPFRRRPCLVLFGSRFGFGRLFLSGGARPCDVLSDGDTLRRQAASMARGKSQPVQRQELHMFATLLRKLGHTSRNGSRPRQLQVEALEARAVPSASAAPVLSAPGADWEPPPGGSHVREMAPLGGSTITIIVTSGAAEAGGDVSPLNVIPRSAHLSEPSPARRRDPARRRPPAEHRYGQWPGGGVAARRPRHHRTTH